MIEFFSRRRNQRVALRKNTVFNISKTKAEKVYEHPNIHTAEYSSIYKIA